MSTIVIKNTRVVQTMEPIEVLEGVDIVIKDDKIVAVGPDAGKDVNADKVINGKNRTVMSGNVCGHHHYYSGLSRGMLISAGPQTDFIQVLKEWWWRLDRGLQEESCYYSSLICSIEAIEAGTTAVIDHHASPSYIEGSLSTIAKGMKETGLRGITCYEVTDRNGGMKEVEEGVRENVRFAKECDDDKKKNGANALCEAMIGGHAPFTIPDDGLKLMSKACKQTKRGMHLHIAEDKYDVVYSHHHYNKDIVKRLEDFDLLNSNTLLVHGLHLSDEEAEIINKHKCFFAHNPRSNMNNHVGYCRVLPKVDNLILGTDGCGGNMFEEIKIGFFKHKDDGGPWWPADYLRALTRANKLLEIYYGRKFGRVEKGYVADLVIYNYQNPTPLVKENVPGHFVWGMSSNAVESVIVNGVLRMENHVLVGIDKEKIFQKAAKCAAKLWKVVDKIKP